MLAIAVVVDVLSQTCEKSEIVFGKGPFLVVECLSGHGDTILKIR